MRDLDVDQRVLEDERKLDPTESRVEQLESQQQTDELESEEEELETERSIQDQARDVDLDHEAERAKGIEPDAHVREIDRDSEARRHYRRVVGRVGALLNGDELDIELERGAPDLSHDEHLALQLLQEAVTGKDHLSHRIVYAERRMQMLEVALATLSPTLSIAFTPELTDLRTSYDQLVEEVGELRHDLDQLDAVQEELIGERAVEQAPADKPKPDETDAPEGVERPSTLFGKPGEPAVDDQAPPSSLYGKPNEPAVEKPATTSTAYEPGPGER